MEKYEPVMIEIIRFENEDVITTSTDTTTDIVWDETNNS